jgi:redox-sensitive bicupin YhaK (pirin superfamily)
MITIRSKGDRGHANHGWLDTWHSFSFGDYYDPDQMGFQSLRVINEDFVSPGQGFGMHGHRDMEIVTLVLEGALEHRDSLGTGSVIRPGELQRMSAGTGIRHSEFNPSANEAVHLYQIWLLPDRAGHKPSYEQKSFPESERRGKFRLVASPDGRDGSLTIHQDANLYLATLGGGTALSHPIRPGRSAWLQVLRGTVQLNDQRLTAGDGAAVENEMSLAVRAENSAEVLLFDLA